MALFSKKNKTEEKKEEKVVEEPQTNEVKSAPKKSESPKTPKGKKGRQIPIAYKELIHPLLTEKSTILGAYNQYVFAVAKTANKVEIKKAITEIYGVTPLKVKTINNLGKKVRSGRGKVAKLKDWKKAIIVLPQGKTIDLYEGV